MEALKAFGKSNLFYVSVIVTIFPVISAISHIITKEGRDSLKDSPILILYFILMPIYGYFYWFDSFKLEAFLGLNKMWQFFFYVVGCLGIIIEKKVPS